MNCRMVVIRLTKDSCRHWSGIFGFQWSTFRLDAERRFKLHRRIILRDTLPIHSSIDHIPFSIEISVAISVLTTKIANKITMIEIKAQQTSGIQPCTIAVQGLWETSFWHRTGSFQTNHRSRGSKSSQSSILMPLGKSTNRAIPILTRQKAPCKMNHRFWIDLIMGAKAILSHLSKTPSPFSSWLPWSSKWKLQQQRPIGKCKMSSSHVRIIIMSQIATRLYEMGHQHKSWSHLAITRNINMHRTCCSDTTAITSSMWSWNHTQRPISIRQVLPIPISRPSIVDVRRWDVGEVLSGWDM
mmetsp:Transcript_4849/g.11502  ORF Transcript_4849/g.11502 Transcript_4849/m.11502 type:complete len:299 (+) Transcript_4849:3090-3986(+)